MKLLNSRHIVINNNDKNTMSAAKDFQMFVGSTLGFLKGISLGEKPHISTNLQNVSSITDREEMTTMTWSDNEEKEILMACGKKDTRRILIYNSEALRFTNIFTCNVGTGKITGLSRNNDTILAAVESGEIVASNCKGRDQTKLIDAGENLLKMKSSNFDKNVIAVGGNENPLKLYDVERRERIFLEKNLPHDSLQLRIPVWVSDVAFLADTKVVSVGRYGHVRLYDTKVQRRPVVNITMKDEPLSTVALTPKESHVIVGSGKGKMNLIDLRNPGKVLNTYKGYSGGVTGVACGRTEPLVVSVSLDRYVRVHHIDTKQLLKQVYIKSKASCLVLRSGFSLNSEENCRTERNSENDEDEEAEKDEYDEIFDKMEVVENKKKRTSKPKRLKRDTSEE